MAVAAAGFVQPRFRVQFLRGQRIDEGRDVVLRLVARHALDIEQACLAIRLR